MWPVLHELSWLAGSDFDRSVCKALLKSPRQSLRKLTLPVPSSKEVCLLLHSHPHLTQLTLTLGGNEHRDAKHGQDSDSDSASVTHHVKTMELSAIDDSPFRAFCFASLRRLTLGQDQHWNVRLLSFDPIFVACPVLELLRIEGWINVASWKAAAKHSGVKQLQFDVGDRNPHRWTSGAVDQTPDVFPYTADALADLVSSLPALKDISFRSFKRKLLPDYERFVERLETERGTLEELEILQFLVDDEWADTVAQLVLLPSVAKRMITALPALTELPPVTFKTKAEENRLAAWLKRNHSDRKLKLVVAPKEAPPARSDSDDDES